MKPGPTSPHKRRVRTGEWRPALCGKVQHPTRAAATAALHSLVRRKRNQGHLNVYHCARCGAYHFGHIR